MLLLDYIKRQFSNSFIRNVGWLAGAELFNRILRVVAVIILARLLSAYDYGLVAIILATNEFSSIFALKGGIGAKLIQADQADLPLLAETAYWMNWLLGIFLFFLQCLASFPIAWFYENNQLIFPICVSGIVYLISPFFSVQSALIYREERLNIIAVCNALQAVVGNILTILFAYLGMGLWAVVLPISLTPFVWLAVILKEQSWRPKSKFTLYQWQVIFHYSTGILGIEVLNKIRANLDYLLVGRFIGLEALGVYYFAFNAGLGISLNLLNAVSWSIFPHLCEARGDLKLLHQRYFNSQKKIALITVPFIILQAILAPFYVPIVYGQKWISAIPILMIICFSAIPRPFAEAASKLLQAINKVKIDLYWNLIFTVFFSAVLIIAVNWNILGVAIAVLIAHAIALPIFTSWVHKYVFLYKLDIPKLQ